MDHLDEGNTGVGSRSMDDQSESSSGVSFKGGQIWFRIPRTLVDHLPSPCRVQSENRSRLDRVEALAPLTCRRCADRPT
jgi:hypothetical protein